MGQFFDAPWYWSGEATDQWAAGMKRRSKIGRKRRIACVVFSGLVGIRRRMKFSDEAAKLMDATFADARTPSPSLHPVIWRRKRSVSPHNRLTWIHSWFCRCNRITVRHHSQIASGRGHRGLDTFWGGVSLCTSLMLMHLCPPFPRAQVDKCHPQ